MQVICLQIDARAGHTMNKNFEYLMRRIEGELFKYIQFSVHLVR